MPPGNEKKHYFVHSGDASCRKWDLILDRILLCRLNFYVIMLMRGGGSGNQLLSLSKSHVIAILLSLMCRKLCGKLHGVSGHISALYSNTLQTLSEIEKVV